MRRLLISCLLVFSLNTAIAAQIYDDTLPNGLRLVILEDHRFPVAMFQIWYRVGGSYENDGMTGISHVVEHMMFEGTPGYPGTSFSKIIADHGGSLNAFTTDDYTAYYEKLPANQIGLAFKLEADRMQHASMSSTAFAKQIEVVMEERRMRYDDQPVMTTYERMRAAAFLSNPYHHLTIGWMGDLRNMTVEDVRAWYQNWYVPNNATIVVVGDVERYKVLELAKQYFGNIPHKKLPLVKPVVDQTPLGERIVKVAVPAEVPILLQAYTVPSIKSLPGSRTPYALDLLAAFLAGSDNSVLNRTLVREQHVASKIQISYNPFSRLNTIFVIYAVPAQGKTIQELQAALARQIQIIQNQPINLATLEAVKSQFIANKIYEQDSLDSQASNLGILSSVFLPVNLADTYIDSINAVTPEQLQLAAQKCLQTDRLTTAILMPLPISDKDSALVSDTFDPNLGAMH